MCRFVLISLWAYADTQLKPPEQQLTATDFLPILALIMVVSHLLSWQSAMTGLECLNTWHEGSGLPP